MANDVINTELNVKNTDGSFTIIHPVTKEENIITPDKSSVFYCKGYEIVAKSRIYCSDKSGHGYLSLRGALQYSCNPAFIQLGKKIGASTLYRYYDPYTFST